MFKKKLLTVVGAFLMVAFVSCDNGPQPIQLGKDSCAFCKMSIADKNFGAEIITKKGKVFKFDDTHCLVSYRKEKIDSNDIKEIYFVNFSEPHNFIKAENVLLLSSPDLHSPMGGNTAAFDKVELFNATQSKVNGEKISRQEMYNTEQ